MNNRKQIENQINIFLPYLKEDFAEFVAASIADGMHLNFHDFESFAAACVEIFEEMKE